MDCCWVKKGWSESGHGLSGCDVLDGAVRKPYVCVRERLRYDENSCRYVCLWLEDWCELHKIGEGCMVEHAIILLCLSGWFFRECREKIKKMVACGFDSGDE